MFSSGTPEFVILEWGGIWDDSEFLRSPSGASVLYGNSFLILLTIYYYLFATYFRFSNSKENKFKYNWWVLTMASVNRDMLLKDATLHWYTFMELIMPFSENIEKYICMTRTKFDVIPNS